MLSSIYDLRVKFCVYVVQAYTGQRLAVFSDSVTQRGVSRRVRNDEAMGVASSLPAPRAQAMRGDGCHASIAWGSGAATALRLVGMCEAKAFAHTCRAKENNILSLTKR